MVSSEACPSESVALTLNSTGVAGILSLGVHETIKLASDPLLIMVLLVSPSEMPVEEMIVKSVMFSSPLAVAVITTYPVSLKLALRTPGLDVKRGGDRADNRKGNEK